MCIYLYVFFDEVCLNNKSDIQAWRKIIYLSTLKNYDSILGAATCAAAAHLGCCVWYISRVLLQKEVTYYSTLNRLFTTGKVENVQPTYTLYTERAAKYSQNVKKKKKTQVRIQKTKWSNRLDLLAKKWAVIKFTTERESRVEGA